MEYTLTALLKSGDRVCGAFGYNRNTGAFVAFKAGAVVLASGGWGRMYRYTSNSWECSGDGAAMAYQAGADLLDMEFMQFHPTGMIWPPGARGILVTEAVRGEGGLLFNAEGSRFMLDYDPVKKELSSRDVVARSIYKEVQAGRGTPHGGAYLDVRHLGADYVKRKLPSMYEQFHALASIDITSQPMEVGPTIHYTMGGVRVDPETAATTRARAVRGRRGGRRSARRQPSRRQFARRHSRVRAARGRRRRRVREDDRMRRASSTMRRSRPSRRTCSSRSVATPTARRRREPLQAARGPAAGDAG